MTIDGHIFICIHIHIHIQIHIHQEARLTIFLLLKAPGILASVNWTNGKPNRSGGYTLPVVSLSTPTDLDSGPGLMICIYIYIYRISSSCCCCCCCCSCFSFSFSFPCRPSPPFRPFHLWLISTVPTHQSANCP